MILYKPRKSLQRPQGLDLPEKAALADASKREFLRRGVNGGLSLGALALVGGFALTRQADVDKMLAAMSRWNDKAAAKLFDPNKLAPTYTEADITRPFPFNAFYGPERAPVVGEAGYRLELGGKIADKTPWTLAQLRALPQEEQITRHVCVEGWSAIGRWGGVPFGTFLQRIGADLRAPFVGFKCADDYYTSIDMATALHPQTIMALTYDGQVLPREYGFPFKLRIPTKLGFKNPKHVMAIEVSGRNPGGYWEDQGYNWFSGL